MNVVSATDDMGDNLLVNIDEQNNEILQTNSSLNNDLDDEYDSNWNCSEDDINYTQVTDILLSDEEINQYISDIDNLTSNNYNSFIEYLIHEKGYEFRLNSKVDNGYVLYSTQEYTWRLYSGENYTTQINETYFISTQDREGYIIDYQYFPDVIYFFDGNYYLDEDYLGWLKWINNNTIINSLTNIPFEYQNISSKSPSRSFKSTLPSRYDYRDHGWVTPIKEQLSNDCWAFASIAALESYLLKNYGESYNFSYDLDFSEKHLRNVMSSKGKQGTDYKIIEGNNLLAPLAYFIRWSGPINENEDSYSTNPTSIENLTPVKHVQGIKILPKKNYYTLNEIKNSVYQYGAVVTNIFWNFSYINSEKSSFYNPNFNETVNPKISFWHAVTIIGWDDNYSKYNFINQPKGDGAFIVKNSHGNSSNDGGYYYVSYYDETLAQNSIGGFVFTNVENNNNYAYNYHYTPLGLNNFKVINGSYLKFYNEWTAIKNENLKACGFYVSNSIQCHINVSVNNQSKFVMTKTLDYPGYHTIDFNKLIPIYKNQKFRIEITLINFNPNYKIYRLPLESPNYGYSKVSSNIGESFVFIDDEGWIDVSKKYYNSNICLNAYTEYVERMDDIWLVNDFVCDYGSGEYLVAKLVDKYGNPLINKNVTFSGKGHIHYKTTDSEGKVYLQINLYPGTYLYNVNYDGDDNFKQTNKYVKVIVNKVTPILINNLDCYFGESLDITLKYGNYTLNNKKIVVKTTSNTFNIITDNSNKASLIMHLVNNTYSLKILFLGDKIYNPINKTINFTVKQTSANIIVKKYTAPYNSGKYFKLKIINSITGKAISGVKVTVKFKKSSNIYSHTILTDNKGIAKLHISKYSLGTYSAEITTNKRYAITSAEKTTATITKASTSVNAPKIINKYKTTQYFRVTVKHATTGKTISSLKLNLKIYTGSNFKTYQITTNNKGIASFNTNSLSIATHKVEITSPNTKYTLSKISSITIKK